MIGRLVTAFRLQRNFSSRTRKSTTPRMIKDPRFTSEGYLNKVQKKHIYDLEGVPNAQLYYNFKEARKLERKSSRARVVALRNEPEATDDSYPAVIADLANHELVLRGNRGLPRLGKGLHSNQTARKQVQGHAGGLAASGQQSHRKVV
jgi:hypothetical protein